MAVQVWCLYVQARTLKAANPTSRMKDNVTLPPSRSDLFATAHTHVRTLTSVRVCWAVRSLHIHTHAHTHKNNQDASHALTVSASASTSVPAASASRPFFCSCSLLCWRVGLCVYVSETAPTKQPKVETLTRRDVTLLDFYHFDSLLHLPPSLRPM